MSLVEAATNVAVGYGLAVLTQIVVFPWFGLPARVSDALAIGAIFTAVSIARSYALRRMFEAIRARRAKRCHAKGTPRVTADKLSLRCINLCDRCRRFTSGNQAVSSASPTSSTLSTTGRKGSAASKYEAAVSTRTTSGNSRS